MTEQASGAPADCPLCHGAGFMFNVPCALYCDYYVRPRKEDAMPAKTNAERQRELRQNRLEQGLKEVRNLWCHPEDEARIRDYSDRLAKQREKQSSRKR